MKRIDIIGQNGNDGLHYKEVTTMEIIERKKGKKETCFGCKHLEVKDIWRGMHTASCGLTEGLITPHEWTGDKVIITGVGDFCKGKEVDNE